MGGPRVAAMLGLVLCLSGAGAAQDVSPDAVAGMQAAAGRRALIEALAAQPHETLREMGIPDLLRRPGARIRVGPDPDLTISLEQHLEDLIFGVARSAGPRCSLAVAGALAEMVSDAGPRAAGAPTVAGCLSMLGAEALGADLPPWERADYLAAAATYMGILPLWWGQPLGPVSPADLRGQALANYCVGMAACCRTGDTEAAADLLECAYQIAPEEAESSLLATLQEQADAVGPTGDLRQMMGLLLLLDRVGPAGGGPLLTSLNQQAEQLAAAGQVEPAKQTLLQLVTEHERRQTYLGYQPALRQRWAEAMQGQYGLLLTLACEAGDSDLALEVSEYRRARIFREQWRERCLEMPSLLPPPLQAQRQMLHRMRAQLAAVLAPAMPEGFQGATLGFYVPLQGDYLPLRQNAAPPMPGDVLQGLIEDTEEQQTQFELALRAQVPGYEAAAAVQPRPAATLRSLISSTEGLLAIEYSMVRGRYVAVAVPAQGQIVAEVLDAEGAAAAAAAQAGVAPIAPRGAPSEPPRAIPELVRDFRDAVAKRDDAAADRTGRALYDRLLAPFGDLLGEAKALLLVTDGSLHFLPFEALPTPDGAPLLTRLPVYYAPSLAMLGERAQDGMAPSRSLLALGNPTFGAAPTEAVREGNREADAPAGSSEAAEALPGQAAAPLPGTQAEIEAIAECFEDPVLLSGTDATREAFLQLAGQFRVVHLATHSYADAQCPDTSDLLFAPAGPGDPGVLQAFEAYDMRLTADLVVLSACEAGGGGELPGAGVLGLSRAFLSAGAGEVLCSLWKAPDEATTQLMRSFYRHWTAGEPTGEALRAAQLEVRSNPQTAGPLFWSGFVLIEGPGAGGLPATAPTST